MRRFFGNFSQIQPEFRFTIPAPKATDPIPEPLQSLALFARMYDPRKHDPWMVENTLRERYREMHRTIPLPELVKGKYPKPLENILAQYYGYASGDPSRSIRAFWYHAHGYAPNSGPLPRFYLYPSLVFPGFGYFPTPRERQAGKKRLYMWIAPGKRKARSITASSAEYWKERGEGKLYIMFAYSADHARKMIERGEVSPYGVEPPKVKVMPRPIPPEPSPPIRREPVQLRFFGLPSFLEKSLSKNGDGLSGRLFHCVTWEQDPFLGFWRCRGYATACQARGQCVVAPEARLRKCIRTKKVPSVYYKKDVERCAQYAPVCGPCITSPAPKPEPLIKEPDPKEIRAVAEWMAEEAAAEKAVDPKWIAREILSRGGIRAYRGHKEMEEYRAIPLFLKKREGLPPDEMASEMGFRSDVELYEAIHEAYPPVIARTHLQRKIERRRPTWRDYEGRAYSYLITQRRREAGLEGRL